MSYYKEICSRMKDQDITIGDNQHIVTIIDDNCVEFDGEKELGKYYPQDGIFVIMLDREMTGCSIPTIWKVRNQYNTFLGCTILHATDIFVVD